MSSHQDHRITLFLSLGAWKADLSTPNEQLEKTSALLLKALLARIKQSSSSPIFCKPGLIAEWPESSAEMTTAWFSTFRVSQCLPNSIAECNNFYKSWSLSGTSLPAAFEVFASCVSCPSKAEDSSSMLPEQDAQHQLFLVFTYVIVFQRILWCALKPRSFILINWDWEYLH